jgi:hypothetical protein
LIFWSFFIKEKGQYSTILCKKKEYFIKKNKKYVILMRLPWEVGGFAAWWLVMPEGMYLPKSSKSIFGIFGPPKPVFTHESRYLPVSIVKYLFFYLQYVVLFCPSLPLDGQNVVSVRLKPVFNAKVIPLATPLPSPDSLTLLELRFYLGHFTFYKNNVPVLEDKTYHLLDLEDENSLSFPFYFPENTPFDSLAFNLGVDSLTTAAGAMGGDLDPTKGMFWTWQSGYINVKMEGCSKKSPERNGEFQFHLGGYMPP